jgi:hypothetical protein
MILNVEKEITNFKENEIEVFASVFFEKEEIGSFLIYKKNYISLESVEVNNKFLGLGYGKYILYEIQKEIELLQDKNTSFFYLEVYPFKNGPLRYNHLVKFYKKYLQVEETSIERIMIKSLHPNKSLKECEKIYLNL